MPGGGGIVTGNLKDDDRKTTETSKINKFGGVISVNQHSSDEM